MIDRPRNPLHGDFWTRLESEIRDRGRRPQVTRAASRIVAATSRRPAPRGERVRQASTSVRLGFGAANWHRASRRGGSRPRPIAPAQGQAGSTRRHLGEGREARGPEVRLPGAPGRADGERQSSRVTWSRKQCPSSSRRTVSPSSSWSCAGRLERTGSARRRSCASPRSRRPAAARTPRAIRMASR
jgi:hypothetical protein